MPRPQRNDKKMEYAVATFDYAICRILGNSLPPRHASGNTVKSLQFILNNEDNFERTKKLWVLNRLVDAVEAKEIKEIIKSSGQEFIDIPFSPAAHFEAFLDVSGMPKPFEDEYGLFQNSVMATFHHEWTIRHKSLHVANINQARNLALKHGRAVAKWTLVLDGGVVFNRHGWNLLVERTRNDEKSKFILIPMTRIAATDTFESIKTKLYEGEEPQIALRFDTDDEFDETLRYGNANKIEFIKRIGFPGIWDHQMKAPWDKKQINRSKDAGLFCEAGLVIRLPTGAEKKTEKDDEARWNARFQGIDNLSASLDVVEAARRFDKKQIMHSYCQLKPSSAEQLEAACEDCMKDNILSVLDKPSLAPSGDPKDFVLAQSYLRRLEDTISDARVDKTDQSQDVIGFSRFLRHSSILAYGGHALGMPRYSQRALEYLRVWMVNDATRMNPHLNFTQHVGKNSPPNPVGLVVARDLWLLPQTIDLLHSTNTLESTDEVKINWWCKQLLRGLSKSEQFQVALGCPDNISTWAAAIVTSLSLHAGELTSAMHVFRNATVKFAEQVGPLNIQHYELKRTRPLHYSLFNLAGWGALVSIFRRVGIDLLKYRGQNGESLQGAIRLLSQTRVLFSDYEKDAAEFDKRIEATMAVLGVTQDKEQKLSFALNRDWGFAPLWPALNPNEN